MALWCAGANMKPRPTVPSMAARHLVRAEVEGHTQGLEHIGTAAGAGYGAIAVLGHLRSPGRDDETRRRRHVEKVGTVTTGAHEIDEVRAPDIDRCRHVAHDCRRAGDLVNRFSLDAQGDQQRADLCIRGVSGHDLPHDRHHGVALEVLTLDHLRQRCLYIHQSFLPAPRRKFSSSA
jgi:hypothetical protein